MITFANEYHQDKLKNNGVLADASDLFEVGIEVKVTKRKHGHSFKIGGSCRSSRNGNR